MRLNSYLKLLCVFVSALILSGCGFHLRGDYSVPKELSQMSVTSYDQYSVLTRDVKNQLRLSNVEIVQPAVDMPNLHLLSESTGETTLSIYQNTNAAEKQIQLTVSYQVTIPNLGSKTFTTKVTRTYLANSLAALAKSVEVDMLENEMRKAAAERIMLQMARLKANIIAGSMTLASDEDQYDNVTTQPSVEASSNSVPNTEAEPDASAPSADSAQGQ